MAGERNEYDALLEGDGANEYDALLQQDRAESDRLRGLFSASIDVSPERHAGILKLAADSGIKPDLIEPKYEELQRAWTEAKRDPDQFRRDHPDLADLILRRPETAPIVIKEAPRLSLIRRILSASEDFGKSLNLDRELFQRMRAGETVEAVRADQASRVEPTKPQAMLDRTKATSGEYLSEQWRRGNLTDEYGTVNFRRAIGAASWQDEKRAVELDTEMLPADYGDRNTALEIGGIVAEQTPLTLNIAKEAGAIGAAAALAVGTGAYVVSRGNKQAAFKAARATLKTVGRAAAMAHMFRVETGSTFRDLERKATLDDGTKINIDTARGAAIAYGVAATLLEDASLGKLLGAFGPMGEAIKRGEGKAWLRQAMKRRTFREALARAGKSWAEAAATEGWTEAAQRVAQDVAGWFAGDKFNLGETARGALEEGATAAVGSGAGLGLVGSTVSVITETGKLNRDLNNGERVRQLVPELKDTPVGAVPSVISDMMERAKEQDGEVPTSVHLDPQALVTLFQGEGVTDVGQAADALLGDGYGQKVADALTTGENVEVPIGTYIERIVNSSSDLATRLADDTALQQDGQTTNQARAREKAVQEMAQKVADRLKEELADDPTLRRLADSMGKPLATTEGAETGDKVSSIVRAFVGTMVAEFNRDLPEGEQITADDLFGKTDIELLFPGDEQRDAVGADALAQPEGEDQGTTGYFAIDSWAGRTRHAGEVVGETGKRYRIRLTEDVRMPNGEEKKAGDVVLVPKTAWHFGAPKEQNSSSPTNQTLLQTTPAVRFDAGKKLTEAEKRTVLDSMVDVYKAKGAPKEEKGTDPVSGDVRYGYAYSPDLFEKSDITGKPVRYYVTLPDGRKAHPSELFPNLGEKEVEKYITEQELKQRDVARQTRAFVKTVTENRATRVFASKGDAVRDYHKRNQGLSGRPFNESIKGYQQMFDPWTNEAGEVLPVRKGTTPNALAEQAGAQELGFSPPEAQPLLSSGPAGPRGAVQKLQNGDRTVYRVSLFSGADKSTPVHELAHIFMFLLQDLAVRPDAPKRVKEDLAETLSWLGADSADAITREQAEKFAEAFEVYLSEGAAPSPALVPVFERFLTWLKNVWRRVARPDVELDSQIRGIFDRLLATDDEIATMRFVGDLSEASTNAIAARTRAAVLKAQQTENSKEYRATLAEVKSEVADEVKKRPGYRARQFLKGVMPPATDTSPEAEALRALGPVKLDRKVVERMAPGEVENLGGLMGRAADGAMHPDDVAPLFGYESGDALLVDLAEYRSFWKVVNAEVEARMQERFPELLERRAELKTLVADAAHESEPLDVLEKELRDLAIKAKDSNVAFDPEVPKAAAAILFGRFVAGTVSAARFLSRELVLSNTYAAALRKGDWAAARKAKFQQLVNFHLYKLARAFEKEQTKAGALYKRMQDDEARARVAKGGRPFLDAIEQILEAVGAREAVVSPEPRATVDEALQLMEALGRDPSFDVDAIRTLLAQPRKLADLTVAEARNVYRAVAEIRWAAHRTNDIVVEGQRRALDGVVQAITDEAERLPDRGPVRTPRSLLGRAQEGRRRRKAERTDPEFFLRRLGRTAWLALWDRYLGGRQKADELARGVLQEFIGLWDNLPQSMKDSRFDRVDGSSLKFPDDVNRPGIETRMDAWMLFLNMGNESNKERLLGGYGWTEEQVLEFLGRTLTKEEADFLQGMLTLVSQKLWPDLAAAEERMNGLAPEKIQPSKIVLPFGEYKGGYFPAKYDPVASRLGQAQASQAEELLKRPPWKPTRTIRSFAKGRAVRYQDVISLDWNVVPRHMAQVVHHIAFGEFARDADRLMQHGGFQRVMQRRLGIEGQKALESWLRAVVAPGGTADETPGHMALLGQLRSNFVRSTIGASLTVAAGDLINPLTSVGFGRIKAPYAARPYLASLAVAPWVRMRRAALALSPELRHREDAAARAMRDKLGAVGRDETRLRSWLDVVSFGIFAVTERMTATVVWQAAFDQAKASGATEADAVAWADERIREAFPTHDAAEQPALLRDKKGIGVLLSFHGYFNKMLNLNQRVWEEANDAWSQAETGEDYLKATGKATHAFIRTVGGLTAAVVLGDLLSGRGPDPDEGWGEWYLRKIISAPAQLFPFIGGMAESAAGELTSWAFQPKPKHRRVSARSAPSVAAIERLYESFQRARTKKSKAEKAAAVAELVGTLAGAPVNQIKRTGGYLYAVGTGEEQPTGPLDVGSGVVYGKRKNQPKNPLSVASDVVEK